MIYAGSSISTQRLDANLADDVQRAASLLRGGGLVAMPTETVYGLAANALDSAAVERIFVAKQRPHWDPLIVHISDGLMLRSVVREVSETARKLMEAFWPGPLTLLLQRNPDLPASVTAGRDLAGVRMPAHPAALVLIHAAGLPLAAPSANRFGHISPTTAQHVFADLDGRIDAVLDAGSCSIGVESTVFDPAEAIIYRQGGISARQIEAVTGIPVRAYEPSQDAATVHTGEPASLPSPGVGIRHYAPRARVLLVHTEAELHAILDRLPHSRTGVMLPSNWTLHRFRSVLFPWAAWDDPVGLARTLYEGLRTLDAAEIKIIVCPLPTGHDPLSTAVRDRLLKAARER